jgi:Predicted membrane protein
LAYFITVATPTQTPENLWFIFICGAIAICAMILPGISGSFILVLLGKYFYIMEAVKSFKVTIMATFAIGAIIGIISFSNILSWLLKKYHDLTIATLSGFMLGSLNKVWPWKETIETFTDSHGVVKPLVEKNIMPNESIIPAIILALIGFFIVIGIEYISERMEKK